MKPAAFLAALSLTALLGWQRLPPAHTDLVICINGPWGAWCRDVAPKPKPKPVEPIKCHEVSR